MQAAVDVLRAGRPTTGRKYDSLIDAVTLADLAAFAQGPPQKARRTQLVVALGGLCARPAPRRST
jgi:hypothetical protein